MLKGLLPSSEHRFRRLPTLYVAFVALLLLLVSISLLPTRGTIFEFAKQGVASHTLSTVHKDVLPPTPSKNGSAGWTFVPSRDERHFKLTEEQCDVAFPNLFFEVDRAADFWAEKGGITERDVDISWQHDSGILRLLVFDQQLFVVEKQWAVPSYDVSRALALLHSIHRAILTSPTPIPNLEFNINVGDWPADPENLHPVWVLSRTADDTSKWVMPDFGYWSWPLKVLGEYSEVRNKITQSEPPWAFKKNQAVWRGATGTNPLRKDLVRVSEGKEWSDIKAIEWVDGQPTVSGGEGTALTIAEHCNYRYVVHTEGHSYSGRTKYLLSCASVSILHSQKWIEPHTHLYIPSGPDQNIVMVAADFSDLDAAMQKLLADDELARHIASNSAKTFRDRYLTPAAQVCYWRRMFHTWAQVSSFEPQLYRKVKEKGRTVRELRGTPYESFVADLYDPASLKKPVTFI